MITMGRHIEDSTKDLSPASAVEESWPASDTRDFACTLHFRYPHILALFFALVRPEMTGSDGM